MPNVFVLCTGRNGSVTFAKACLHIENFTSGHETRCRVLGETRVSYPENHIEVDNRLGFFLGALEEHYGDDAIYIHLRREADAVARSYNTRWHVAEGVMKSWAVGIARQTDFGVRTARFMVDTIEQNITHFLRDKTKKMTIDLETLQDQFPAFLDLIGAQGDHATIMAALGETHNASQSAPPRDDKNLTPEQASIKTLEGIVSIVTEQRKELNSAKRLKDQLGRSETQLKLQSEKVKALKLESEKRNQRIKALDLAAKKHSFEAKALQTNLQKRTAELMRLQRPLPLMKTLMKSIIPVTLKRRMKSLLKGPSARPTKVMHTPKSTPATTTAPRPTKVMHTPKSTPATTTAPRAAVMSFDECLNLIKGAIDPVSTFNTLLDGAHLDVQKAAQSVRTIFSSRDPAFLRLCASETVSHSLALSIIIKIYKSEYQGTTLEPETLLHHWNELTDTEYKHTKNDELYFLLAAIKSEDIMLVDTLLSLLSNVAAYDLPSTYKIGILRLVIAQASDDYEQWRERLELTDLEALQIAELDRKMDIGDIRSHAAYLERLNQTVPDHLKDELNSEILPFFETHSNRLTWIDCRLNTAVKDAFIASIGTALTEKTPWSLIRLGDGESYAWQATLPDEHASMREQIWWGTTLEIKMREKIAREMHHAIEAADVLGVPSLYRFARDTSQSLPSYAEHRSISGLLRVLDGVGKLSPSERQFTEDRIHQVCFDLPTVLELGRKATRLVVVSSLVSESIANCLSPLEGVTPLDFVQIPTHTKTQGNILFSASDVALPFIYEALNAEIAQKVAPGTLVIVASGSIGKIFCQTIREQGGVALDVGAMVDYWVGVKTRSIADMV